MTIRSMLKEREITAYRRMSRGMRIRYAIELSEFVHELSKGVKPHGNRVQGDHQHPQRGKAS